MKTLANIRTVAKLTGKSRSREARQISALIRAVCEPLEDRRLFSILNFFVTNTNDSGTGSLRTAINNVNSGGAQSTITFDIPTTDAGYSGGVFTIKPLSQLPTMTDSEVTLDGNTQETYTGSTNGGRPVIYLNGTSAGTNANGITVTGNTDFVQNLAIENFGVDSGTGGAAVLFTGTGTTTDFVTGCYLGVGPSGSTVALNEYGVWVTNGASADQIGSTVAGDANVIATNRDNVLISGGAGSVTVEGDDIGATALISSSGYSIQGVYINNSANNTIEACTIGTCTGDGFDSGGVYIGGASSTGNSIEGCDIGVLYESGILPGYYSVGSDAGIYIDGASGNLIGGSASGDSNIIAGNSIDGITLQHSTGNVIEQNDIGEASHKGTGTSVVYDAGI